MHGWFGDGVRLAAATSAGRREPARLGGKHGAAHNQQVLLRRRAPHRAGHECRAIILPMRTFVHAFSTIAGEASRDQAVFSCAPVVASKSSSAAAAIDEVGYLSYSSRHADLMFELISRRYQVLLTHPLIFLGTQKNRATIGAIPERIARPRPAAYPCEFAKRTSNAA